MKDKNLEPNTQLESSASEASDDVVIELSQKLMAKNKESYEKLSE